MEMNTCDLDGDDLDWAVWLIEFGKVDGSDIELLAASLSPDYHPRLNWALAGPLLDREDICYELTHGIDVPPDKRWEAKKHSKQPHHFPVSVSCWQYGPTKLVAALRCFVELHLGPVVAFPYKRPAKEA